MNFFLSSLCPLICEWKYLVNYICDSKNILSVGLWHACTNGVNWGCDRTAFGQEILPPIMSGKLTSHAAIKYGRVNVRARIPKGDWIWPGKPTMTYRILEE